MATNLKKEFMMKFTFLKLLAYTGYIFCKLLFPSFRVHNMTANGCC